MMRTRPDQDPLGTYLYLPSSHLPEQQGVGSLVQRSLRTARQLQPLPCGRRQLGAVRGSAGQDIAEHRAEIHRLSAEEGVRAAKEAEELHSQLTLVRFAFKNLQEHHAQLTSKHVLWQEQHLKVSESLCLVLIL